MAARIFDPRRVVGTTAGLIDRAVAAAMAVRGRAEHDARSHADRIAALAEIHAAYDGDALIPNAARFFPAPGKVELRPRPVRPGVWEAAWPSVYEPYLPAVAERWLSRIDNRVARARFYFRSPADAPTTRPAVIAVHGYMGGQWLIEETIWPIEGLLRRGLEVALPVLPMHAGRAGSHRGAPVFPSSDPRLTNEGFRQAVTDLRTLARWLRERGAPKVGIIGMSLGGYTAALTATVTGELDFVMPMIPLASLADFAREQGRLGTSAAEEEEQHAALERASWVVSPLARPLGIPKSRAIVVAAEHDRITPVTHAARLARHFDCEMVTIRGGHLVQIGRSAAFRALGGMLEREGILAPRRRSSSR